MARAVIEREVHGDAGIFKAEGIETIRRGRKGAVHADEGEFAGDAIERRAFGAKRARLGHIPAVAFAFKIHGRTGALDFNLLHVAGGEGEGGLGACRGRIAGGFAPHFVEIDKGGQSHRHQEDDSGTSLHKRSPRLFSGAGTR